MHIWKFQDDVGLCVSAKCLKSLGVFFCKDMCWSALFFNNDESVQKCEVKQCQVKALWTRKATRTSFRWWKPIRRTEGHLVRVRRDTCETFGPFPAMARPNHVTKEATAGLWSSSVRRWSNHQLKRIFRVWRRFKSSHWSSALENFTSRMQKWWGPASFDIGLIFALLLGTSEK